MIGAAVVVANGAGVVVHHDLLVGFGVGEYAGVGAFVGEQ